MHGPCEKKKNQGHIKPYHTYPITRFCFPITEHAQVLYFTDRYQYYSNKLAITKSGTFCNLTWLTTTYIHGTRPFE